MLTHHRQTQHRPTHRLLLALATLAVAGTTPEVSAAKASAAKPKPKPAPQAPAQNKLSSLEKTEKIVSIGKNLWDAARTELFGGESENTDYAYYTASIALVKYQDQTIIESKDLTTTINRLHWLDNNYKSDQYKTETIYLKSNGEQNASVDKNPFPHSWGNVPNLKSVEYPDPGKKIKKDITFSIKPTQYKLLLNLEKASSNPAHRIDSAPILETLNYQEVGTSEDYQTYQDISSSSFIENRPVKTIEFDNRAASIHWDTSQIMQYPLTNCVTVTGDHLVHFLVPNKANIFIVPPIKDQNLQP